MAKLAKWTFCALMVVVLTAHPAYAQESSWKETPTSSSGTYTIDISGTQYMSALMGANVWAACGVSDSNNKLVRTFPKKGGPSGSNAYLKCGSESWGYRHIKARHMKDWRNIASMIGDNWRSFADWAIEQTLKSPGSVDYNSNNDTWSFKAPLQIKDQDGNVIATYHPLVSVADDSKNIITAYPRR